MFLIQKLFVDFPTKCLVQFRQKRKEVDGMGSFFLPCWPANQKKYRKSRGYTIEQFSAMINKSKATVSKYETAPSPSTWRRCMMWPGPWIST